MSEVERLLRGALVPIEPPERMGDRLERRLVELTDAAVVGTTAGAALVLLRARQQRRRRARPHGVVDAAEQALKDVYGEARKLLPKS